MSTEQAATTFARTFGKSFLNTAKENFVQQFTGWNQEGMFCRFMKGFGLYGQAKEHYDIWTDDEKSTWEKIQASGMPLILDVFAAKGATTVCFPAGTKVHTQWGLADIEKLEIGVSVLTYNEETGRQEYKQVKKVMRVVSLKVCNSSFLSLLFHCFFILFFPTFELVLLLSGKPFPHIKVKG